MTSSHIFCIFIGDVTNDRYKLR